MRKTWTIRQNKTNCHEDPQYAYEYAKILTKNPEMIQEKLRKHPEYAYDYAFDVGTNALGRYSGSYM